MVASSIGKIAAVEPYSPFAPLTHPGTFLLLTSIVTWLVFSARGYYRTWASGEGPTVLRATFKDAVPASVPVIAFLVMARLMDHSGQNEMLALGIAAWQWLLPDVLHVEQPAWQTRDVRLLLVGMIFLLGVGLL